MQVMQIIRFITIGILFGAGTFGFAQEAATIPASPTGTFVGWVTNGPAVLQVFKPPVPSGFFTNAQGLVRRRPVSLTERTRTNVVFSHFVPDSLNNLVWTNFIAHTNGRSVVVWSRREHPPGWPANPPLAVWNPNSLMWGMKGLTALSPCWELEYSPGQCPITALTRRHGYTRGHDMGPSGFRTSYAGRKVWFVSTNNTMVEVKILREVVRIKGIDSRDYTIVLFDRDLPVSVEPMRVLAVSDLLQKYPDRGRWLLLELEQGGCVSAGLPGFTVDTVKGGDSGSANILPVQDELIFTGGRSTSPPSREMQIDMDALCRMGGLDWRKYQMQWADVSKYPAYTAAAPQ